MPFLFLQSDFLLGSPFFACEVTDSPQYTPMSDGPVFQLGSMSVEWEKELLPLPVTGVLDEATQLPQGLH